MNTPLHPTTPSNQNTSLGESVAPHDVIYLGLDVHLAHITVCRKVDGLVPQPVQKMDVPKLLSWVRDQRARGARVLSCYEAGPCGYVLHRQLCALGVENLVIAPEDWDERGERVKTDKRDARALCARRWRYHLGETKAFCVVYVPTCEQEQRRALCRQRAALVRQRQQATMRGRSLALLQGFRLSGRWWAPRSWRTQGAALPEALRTALALWVQQAQWLEAQQKQLHAQILQFVPALHLSLPSLPIGLGGLSWVLCATEVVDWHRFHNRRQVSSYTGLCPSEHSSGSRRRQGSITRHGNPRLRHALIEAAWRLLRYQPGYWVWKKLPGLLDPTVGSIQRKRLLVAAARHLAIDLWRLATGRTTPEKLGLRVAPAPTATA